MVDLTALSLGARPSAAPDGRVVDVECSRLSRHGICCTSTVQCRQAPSPSFWSMSWCLETPGSRLWFEYGLEVWVKFWMRVEGVVKR